MLDGIRRAGLWPKASTTQISKFKEPNIASIVLRVSDHSLDGKLMANSINSASQGQRVTDVIKAWRLLDKPYESSVTPKWYTPLVHKGRIFVNRVKTAYGFNKKK